MPSRDLSTACSKLQRAIPYVLAEYRARFPERELRLGEVSRTQEEQQEKWAVGRTTPPIGPKHVITKCDGVRRLSPHQPQTKHGELASHAVDLNVFVGGIYHGKAKDLPFYLPLVTLAGVYGLRSGADWNRNAEWSDEAWLDAPHMECVDAG